MSANVSAASDEGTLQAGMKGRHLVMMSLGSAIGAGLFVGSGQGIAVAGPAVLIAYVVAGIIVVLIMRMLGEMVAADPRSGAFSVYAGRALGPAAIMRGPAVVDSFSGGLVGGAALTWAAYDAGRASSGQSQLPGVAENIQMYGGAIMGVFVPLSLLVMAAYPLTEDRYAEITAELKERTDREETTV